MDGEHRVALWTFLGMALGFKLVTSIVIFAMAPSAHSFIFLIGMNWYWAIPPVVLLAVPALCWYRLRRARARRRELIRSEWLVDPELDWNPAAPRGTMGKR